MQSIGDCSVCTADAGAAESSATLLLAAAGHCCYRCRWLQKVLLEQDVTQQLPGGNQVAAIAQRTRAAWHWSRWWCRPHLCSTTPTTPTCQGGPWGLCCHR